MLVLKNIVKNYNAGGIEVRALDGVSVDFRRNEFVSILGPSGCGKTTLLNVIGGLDRYDSGDLVINGKSTGDFRDRDWDSYRNHTIGFVFQSYNLIPHQSVLANVELALTLSGVSKSERRKRATEALEKVGLGDQLHKKPNQMSGGQMQRVAIARALVNDPDILLADEPTGALDTATGVRIMEILRDVAKDKLVIMVTHNPELAERYSTRIIRVLDGKILDDSNPYSAAEDEKAEKIKNAAAQKKKARRPSMSFFTALSLSFRNLLTKKGRTFLTAFAGSIGIIGIALILSLSSGIQNYIDRVQEDTLSTYPISIAANDVDMSELLATLSKTGTTPQHEKDAVYSNPVFYQLMNTMNSTRTRQNNLAAFKIWLEAHKSELSDLVNVIEYSYGVPILTYTANADGGYSSTDVSALLSGIQGSSSEMSSAMSGATGFSVWDEILPGKNGETVNPLIETQYRTLFGRMPEKFDEIVLVVDKNQEITDMTLYALGLKSDEDMKKILLAAMSGEEIEISSERYTYEELCNITLKLVLPADFYRYNASTGLFEDIRDDKKTMDVVAANGLTLRVVGILCPDESAAASAINGSVGYTKALTEYIMNGVAESEVVKAQKAPENANRDVLSGLPFVLNADNELPVDQKASAFRDYLTTVDTAKKAEIYRSVLTTPSGEWLKNTVDAYMATCPTRESRENLLAESFGQQLDPELLHTYLASLTDEALEAMLREAFSEIAKADFAAKAESRLSEILETPTAEELAMLRTRITGNLTTKEARIAFVSSIYTERTALPPETVAAYLSSLGETEFSAILEKTVEEQAMEMYRSYLLPGITAEEKNQKLAAAFDAYLTDLDAVALADLYDTYMPSTVAPHSLEENLEAFGNADPASPKTINLYPIDFAAKEELGRQIHQYNETVDENDEIRYTDYVAIMMSSVSTIINVISYVLIAFVAVSLVVSSIMIGIITYISVLERTKEIGILRAIGASKRDISRVFNAETVIIGFTSGSIGIGITVLLCIPINAVIRYLSDIRNIGAALPWQGGLILVAISILLTLIAGLIPARVAAKKDPVAALRTE